MIFDLVVPFVVKFLRGFVVAAVDADNYITFQTIKNYVFKFLINIRQRFNHRELPVQLITFVVAHN